MSGGDLTNFLEISLAGHSQRVATGGLGMVMHLIDTALKYRRNKYSLESSQEKKCDKPCKNPKQGNVWWREMYYFLIF